MLSLFRHATRCSVSAARPALVAHYSDVASDAMAETHAIVKQSADSQASYSRGLGGGGNHSGTPQARETGKWKPFRRDGYVTPHDFTYKARFSAPPTYQTRRAQQGPPGTVARYNDVFHQLDINPLDVTMEPNLISHYVSEMGKVYGRNITGLTSKSQRRLGKAIRRAKMMGVIPILCKSPYYQHLRRSR